MNKTLGNTCADTAAKNVEDMKTWGKDVFKLISKASSEKEGWMKSTKAMQCDSDVIIQVTTQQRNPDGSYAIAEALTTLNDAVIVSNYRKESNIAIRRAIETRFDK
ncbi:MAG: hypothetical protein JJW00_09095 [Sulfurimonas sp.]|nr:hypothetical protein [Sulfurimonas sp.]